ncbi:peptidylprolyl isomerase [Clostridium sp. C105KSO13]|uniref:peptidylprolyl isomerase n=1 Tax=Clostridium sp. C105KSO13 TaxID=1776045 RepID=UPI0007406748|nr:peptidylprolyl isomerase [Clostridium sp. C105KSO13]CUX34166.1 hypothetical protein BN3456_01552 [Clostridium sp. C105KSO13]
MGKFSKRAVTAAVAGTLAIASLTGCGRSMNNDAVVAEVGDQVISLGTANFYARLQQAQYETYYAGMLGTTGDKMWTQEAEKGSTYEDTTKENILKSLEDMYLLKQHAKDYKIELTDDDEKAISKAADAFAEANTKTVKETVSGYKKYITEFLELATIQSKMDAPMKAGVKEDVSDEEAAQKSMQYVLFPYTKTSDDGTSETMPDDEKAALKEKAQHFADTLKTDGGDMDAAAKEADLKVQTAAFDSESTTPPEEVVKAVDALGTEGDVTGIIESDNGIYVAKLTSLLDREATDAKKDTIVEERKQDQYNSLLKKWRKDTDIKEHKKAWKKVSFAGQGVSIKQNTEETGEDTTDGSSK